MSDKDTFARAQARSAHVRTSGIAAELIKLRKQVKEIGGRLETAEARLRVVKAIRNCHYCGAPSIGPVCKGHSDLLVYDDLAPTL